MRFGHLLFLSYCRGIRVSALLWYGKNGKIPSEIQQVKPGYTTYQSRRPIKKIAELYTFVTVVAKYVPAAFVARARSAP